MNSDVRTYVALNYRYTPTGIKYQLESEQHRHNFYQLIYVVSGRGFVSTGNRNCPIGKNDTVLIPPETLHVPYTLGTMTTYEFKFDVSSEFLRGIFPCGKLLLYSTDPESSSLIARAATEARLRRICSEQYISHLIAEIMISLYRNNISHSDGCGGKPLPPAEGSVDDSFANAVKKYIDGNLCEKLEARTIARKFYVSQSYLYKYFVSAYGIPPMKYINNLRIEHAKKLLQTTELSITEVAEAVGFTGLHYFSRYFSNKEHISPAKYRSSVRNGFVVTF